MEEGDAYDRLDERAKAAEAYREAMKAAKTPAEIEAARQKLQGVNGSSLLDRARDGLEDALVTVVAPAAAALLIFFLLKFGFWSFGAMSRKAGLIAIQSNSPVLPASHIEGALRAVLAEIRDQTALVRRIRAGGSMAVASPISAGLDKLTMHEVRVVKEPNELTLPVGWSALLGMHHVYNLARAACVIKFTVLSMGSSLVVVAELKGPRIPLQDIVKKSSEDDLHGTVSDILYGALVIMDERAQ